MKEYSKCQYSALYFTEKYSGIEYLRNDQRAIVSSVDATQRGVLINKTNRQVGVTKMLHFLALHHGLFRNDKYILVVTPSKESAKEFIEQVLEI
jgi:hypothetical protein